MKETNLPENPLQPDEVPALSYWASLLVRHSKLFLLTTAFLAVVILALTWPKVTRPVVPKHFVSKGTLLLLPRNQAGRMQVGLPPSEVDVWLSNVELFMTSLEKSNWREKTANKLGGVPRQSVQRVVVQPQMSRGGQMEPLQNEMEMLGLAPSTQEPDYAKIEEEGELLESRTPRIERLALMAWGDTPEQAQSLAVASIKSLQEVLIETSTRSVRQQRATIEKYISITQKRIQRCEALLQESQKKHGPRLDPKQSRLASLEEAYRRLEAETRDLQRKLESIEAGASVFSSGLESQLTSAIENEVLARQLYQPDSQSLARVQAKTSMINRLASSLQNEGLQAQTMTLRVRLNIYQQLKGKAHEQWRQELELQPSKEARRDYEAALKELVSWELELGSWQKRHLQTRIWEQAYRGSASSAVIQDPLPGKRIWLKPVEWYRVYQKPLKLLPLSLLGGLLAVLAALLWAEVGNVHKRVWTYCEAPVWVEIPPP